MHALSCAAGYNIRWLMRAIVRLAAKRLCLAQHNVALCARFGALGTPAVLMRAVQTARDALMRLLGWRLSPSRLLAMAA